MLLRKTAFWVIFVLILCCPNLARAHDPLNSATIARFNANGLEVRIKLELGTAITLLGGSGGTSSKISDELIQRLRTHTQTLYRISANGVALRARTVNAEVKDEDGAEFLLIYPLPTGARLRFEAGFLSKLPTAHKSSLSVIGDNGKLLVPIKLLTPADRVVEMELPTITESAPVARQATPVIAEATPVTPREVKTDKQQAVVKATPSPQASVSPQPTVSETPAPLQTEPPVNNQTSEQEASPSPNTSNVPLATPTYGTTFWEFLKLGVEHILTGYDHLLFLLGLLIVCRSFASVAGIITCFTIAHSVTLILAAFDLVSVSSRLVEPLITATIIYVGIENLVRREEPKKRWALAFGFGLIHGFGFAGVLKEISAGLGDSKMALALPLFSFNLGVELGQIAITAIVLPLLWQLEKTTWFHQYGKIVISSVVVLLGVYWLVERIFF